MANDSPSPAQKMNDSRSKSCDTVCSSNSGCFLQRRKPAHPLAASLLRPSYSHPTTKSTVKQRILSARLLKLRSIQSQLNDANYHLAELTRENQALKTLQKRQDKALSKYEGMNADLPRLIQSHSEDIRVLTDKNKNLKKNVRELSDQLKVKEIELQQAKRTLDHYEKLNKSKQLGVREKLTEEIEDLKEKLQNAESQVQTLNRKLLLEEKNCKQKISNECAKTKQVQKNLLQALAEIDRLNNLMDGKEKEKSQAIKKRFSTVGFKEIKSSASITNPEAGLKTEVKSSPNLLQSEESMSSEEERREENKPSNVPNKYEDASTPPGVLKSPGESVKARLSGPKPTDEMEKEIADLEKILEQSEGKKPQRNIFTNNKPTVVQKLDKMASSIEFNLQKRRLERTDDDGYEIDEKLGLLCSHIVDSVKNCNQAVEEHRESLEQSKSDLETIRKTVEHLDNFRDRLKIDDNISFSSSDITKALSNGLGFPKASSKGHRNGVNGLFAETDMQKIKKKENLLAALKAIDNGENIEAFT